MCVCVCVGVSVVAPMGGSPVRIRLAEDCPWLSVEEGDEGESERLLVGGQLGGCWGVVGVLLSSCVEVVVKL